MAGLGRSYFQRRRAAVLEDGRRDVVLSELIMVLDGCVVAHLSWDDSGEVISLFTHQDYRRRGLATALWHEARQWSVQHSAWRTDDGDAFARAVGGYLPRRRLA